MRGIYSYEALEGYTAALGTEVRTVDVQATVIALQQKSLIHRLGHGTYSIADPFVKQVSLERQSIKGIGAPGDATPPVPSARDTHPRRLGGDWISPVRSELRRCSWDRVDEKTAFGRDYPCDWAFGVGHLEDQAPW